MNRRSFFKHAVCILFLIFAMGEVWGRDFQSSQTGNWNAERTWWGVLGSFGQKQFPDSQTDDTAEIKNGHTITIPAGFDAEIKKITVNGGGTLDCKGTLTASDEVYISGTVNLTGVINSPKITLSDGAYPGTLTIDNGGEFTLDNTVTVGEGSALNVKSGGKIVLNAWPTPAPTFNDGCIVEIGPSFPDSGLMGLNSALQAVKTNGGTIAELIISRPTPVAVNLDGNYSISKVTVNSTGVSLGNQDGISSIEVSGNGSLNVTQALSKTVTVNDGGSLNLSNGINGSPAINMQGGDLTLSGASIITDTQLNLTFGQNDITVIVDGPTVTLPASLTTNIPSNVTVTDKTGTITNFSDVPPANKYLPDLVVDGSNSPYTLSTASSYKSITVEATGELLVNATLEVDTLINKGTVTATGDVSVLGGFENSGTATVAKITISNPNHNDDESKYAVFANSGTFTSNGAFDSNKINNSTTGNIELTGSFSAGPFVNNGTFTRKTSDNGWCAGITNNGTIYYVGTIEEPNGTHTNNALIVFDDNNNTVYVESKSVAESPSKYTVPNNSNLKLNAVGNVQLVVDGATTISTLNLLKRNNDWPSNFKVEIVGKNASGDKLTINGTGNGIDVSRTAGGTVTGTLQVDCPLAVSNNVYIHSGTSVIINSTVTVGEFATVASVSDGDRDLGLTIAVTVNSGKKLSAKSLFVKNDKISATLTNNGTVEITNGGAFEVYDCATAGDITFTAGGSLTANSFAGNTLTVNTTAASQIFTLNSDVTFADVILEGSSGNVLGVAGTEDFKLTATGGDNSYAGFVNFANSSNPAIYLNNGTTGADILVFDSTVVGGGDFPKGWIDGSKYYIWNGAKDSVWTDDDNWIRKNNPNGKSGIEEIRINTKAGGNAPKITEDVTADKLNILDGKTASVTAEKTLTLKNLSGTGTLNLGKGTLKNGNTDSTALNITETILSFGDGTSATTLVGEIKINKLTSSTGSVNIGTASDQAEVTFVPGVSIGDITVGSGSKVTFTADSSCAKLTNNGTVTSTGTPILSISGDFTDTGIWENVQPKFTDTLNVSPKTGTGYPILWVEAPGKTVTLKGDFSFASGKGVYVNGGTLSVDSGVTITNAKNVSIEKGTLTGAGTLSLTDQLSNKDTVSISKIEFTGTDKGQITSTADGKSYKSVELKNTVTKFTVSKQSTFVDFTDNSSIASPNVLTFSDTATITNSITGSGVNGNIKTNGTNVDVKLSKIDGTFTCSGAKTTVNKALEVTGNVTVEGTLTGNAAITVGKTLTNSGTVKSKSTVTVSENCANTGTISDIDASNTGVLKLGSDFTDSGTTSISEIIFFGDKNHTFTNKAATQYKTVTLDSTIASARIVTVANNANITTFTDNTAKANVTFSGTATLGSITTDSHTEGKYTFTGNARVMSDTTFKAEVEFKADVAFQDNAATPAKTDATFNSKVTFSKASANITGKNLTFNNNVTAKELTLDASQLVLNTKPEVPAAGASPAVPAITFTATKFTFTGTAITVSHNDIDGTCKLSGELFTDTSLTVNNNFHVTKDVKITGGGKTVSVAIGKKLFFGKDFRAQGTSASSKLTLSGDIAITSNENWSKCFAEAVFCTVKDSTVYCWDGSDFTSAEASGTKAKIPCESCTDGNNTTNWIFTDIDISSAKTIDDHRIEIVLNDSIENLASSVTNSGLTTYTVLDCVKGDGKNPDRTLRNGNWKNYSSQSIIYSIESVAPGTGADIGKTIVIISLPADTTWNTDAAATSAGNASSTDSHGVHQTNIPDIIIERGTGGTSEKYTVTNKWGKRFGGTAFTSTSDGASPVLIAVYTGQENHTPGSTDGWDAHNFIEFVYSEEVQGVTAGDAPYTTGAAAGDPKITVDGIASFENGKLDTRNFSDNLENENLNQFYAVGTYSFRWAIASKASGGIWNGYIESITQFSGSVTIPATCVIKDRSSAKNPCVIKTGGLTVSNVKAGDPTVSNWDVIGPDFVPIRKNGEWDAAISAESNFEIVGTSSSGNAVLEKLEFHMFDNAQSFSGSDSVNWVTRNGWINASDYTLLSTDAVTGTFAADIFGGARPFEGTSAGRTGSSVSDRTAGGIRKHTLDSAYTKGAFEYQTVDAEKNVSAVHAFDNLLGDISYGFTAIVFANPDTAITRQVSDPDTLYFGLKLPTSTTELRTTYIISYNPSIGVITDLAGNRFAGTLDGSGKRTVRSIDMTPPKMVMTVSPIGTKRLYVMFAKELQLGKLNLSDIAGQIPTSVNALADIPKSLGLISLSTGDTPATSYLSKTSGEIDIDASVPAKLLFINQNYTGLEFALTKETTLENISNLYLVVKNDSAIENAKDPITGIIGNISYIQDDIGNFLPVNSAHAFSDFAVNAVTPLYAYSTSDAIDGEIVTMNLYGDEQYAVRDFSRDQQNFGTMIPGDDYTFIVKTCDEITDENQFVMIASRSPSAGSVSKIYNETSRTDRRIWLPDAFSAISSVANTNVIESAAPSAVAQGFKFEYSVNGANPVDWGSGDEITFLYEIKKDSFGNDIEICHNPVLSVTGTVDTDAKSPLFALQLDNPADLLSIDLWSFKLKTPVSQRGGVTILNNVINAVYGEKTLVKLDVPKSGANVTVAVMTLDGNIIKYLVSDFLPGGSHYYDWDGTNLNGSPVARGMYFIRVFGDGFDETRKVMVVK